MCSSSPAKYLLQYLSLCSCGGGMLPCVPDAIDEQTRVTEVSCNHSSLANQTTSFQKQVAFTSRMSSKCDRNPGR